MPVLLLAGAVLLLLEPVLETGSGNSNQRSQQRGAAVSERSWRSSSEVR